MLTWPRALLACAVCLAAGWLLHRPGAPRVEVREVVRTVTEWRDRDVVRTVAGPERVVERWRTSAAPPTPRPGCDPCPACTEHTIETERGPVTTESVHDVASLAQTHAAHESVTTPPPALPSWSVSAGAVLSRSGLGWQGGLGRRLLGPVWLEVQASTVPAASAGLRVEF